MNQLEPSVFHLLKLYNEYDTESFEELYKEGKLDSMFLSIARSNRIPALKTVFSYLPDNLKYQTFINVYADAEKGFHQFTIEILESVKNLRPDLITAELNRYADDKGLLTIYC